MSFTRLVLTIGQCILYILIVSYSIQLYIPSALAIASDFWRVTVIGVIAAKQGALEVLTINILPFKNYPLS